MKKMLLVLVFSLFTGIAVLAQVDPPTDIVDAISNLDLYLGSLAGLAALSVFVSAFFIKLFKVIKTGLKIVISWLIPIVISVGIGNLLNIGFLADETILIAVLYGLGAGLVSNGIFDVPFVQTFLEFIALKFKKE